MIQYKRWVSMAVVATTVTVMTLGVNTQAAEHHTEMMYASDHMEIASFAQLLQDSDKVMLITLQDDVSTNKMRYITQCLDFGDNEKYMVICNKYNEKNENQYFQSELQTRFSIKEYIDEISTPLVTTRQLAQLNGIEKMSYMFI